MAEDGKERRRHPRKDVNLRVRVKSNSVDDFVDQFANNISDGGFFLRSGKQFTEGTTLRFEIQLKDGSSMLRGRAVVTWSKQLGSTNNKSTFGVGLKFLDLDADSKALVKRILEYQDEQDEQYDQDIPTQVMATPPPAAVFPSPQRKETLPEPKEMPPAEPEPLEAPPVEPEPVFQQPAPASPSRRLLSRRTWFLLGGLVVVVVVLVFVLLSLSPDDEPAEPAPKPAHASIAPVTDVPATDETEPLEAPEPRVGDPETPDPHPEEPIDANEEPELTPPPIRDRPPSRNRYGTLSLNTRPWVEVYLGPRKLGVTPLVRVKLRAGKHRLKLVNWEDGINKPLVVRVRPGRTTKLVHRFSR